MSCKVLLIDDDNADVEILAKAFERNGLDCFKHVHSAIEGILYLQSVKERKDLPKLIVTDLYLPGVTGLDLLKEIKEMERYKHIHVVVMSGKLVDKEMANLMNSGAVEYLAKPDTFNEYIQIAKDLGERYL